MTRTLPRTAFVLSLSIFILLIMGGIVRNMGAGLACPDWPKCNGEWIPLFDPLVFAEWFHRLLAAIVSLLTLAVAILTWTNPAWRRPLGKLASIAIALIIVQVLMGGLTVLGLNASSIVTAHLVIGAIFFALAVRIWQKSSMMSQQLSPSTLPVERAARPFRRHVIISLVVVLIQIALGGLVSTNHAGLVCPDFPKCNGLWWPEMVGLVRLQMLHRFGAYLVILVVGATVAFSWKLQLDKPTRRWLRTVTLLLILQVLIGIGAIHAKLPLAISVAHLGLGMALFASLTALATHVYRR